jgi:hypothetical protein
MRLIKLYRELLDFRKEYIKRLNLYDHLWIYFNSSRDAEIVKQIFEIEKNIK